MILQMTLSEGSKNSINSTNAISNYYSQAHVSPWFFSDHDIPLVSHLPGTIESIKNSLKLDINYDIRLQVFLPFLTNTREYIF